jgi:hypothetical protein
MGQKSQKVPRLRPIVPYRHRLRFGRHHFRSSDESGPARLAARARRSCSEWIPSHQVTALALRRWAGLRIARFASILLGLERLPRTPIQNECLARVPHFDAAISKWGMPPRCRTGRSGGGSRSASFGDPLRVVATGYGERIAMLAGMGHLVAAMSPTLYRGPTTSPKGGDGDPDSRDSANRWR